ncbi:MAG: hypothetical protein EHM45_19815 [Desulfobacteraceae bacterium]|nr:MAG: hypothetical protein EHM45_19815 [Desulfobacteraceae bacterium]
MKKKLTVVIAIFGVAGILTAAILQDFSRYEILKNPQFGKMADQKMLVVEAKGDPNTAGAAAFGLLFKTFFSLKGVQMTAPRARWSSPGGVGKDPKEQWIGFYALPLPETITALPAGTEGARIETWTYGDVAEILHIGGYGAEAPTISRLHKFIADGGYEIAGMHEEEYIRGPGMASDPSQYLTIIRYPVKKK